MHALIYDDNICTTFQSLQCWLQRVRHQLENLLPLLLRKANLQYSYIGDMHHWKAHISKKTKYSHSTFTIHNYVHMYTHKHMYTHTHKHIYIYIHTHTHTNIHKYTAISNALKVEDTLKHRGHIRLQYIPKVLEHQTSGHFLRLIRPHTKHKDLRRF